MHISLIFNNLAMTKKLSYHQYMYNLYSKFIKILEICKQFSQDLVNEAGNIPRKDPVPEFSDLKCALYPVV